MKGDCAVKLAKMHVVSSKNLHFGIEMAYGVWYQPWVSLVQPVLLSWLL
jgi:hypothetical protein